VPDGYTDSYIKVWKVEGMRMVPTGKRVHLFSFSLLVIACVMLGAAFAQGASGLNIEVASSPAEFVSGGGARLVISVPSEVKWSNVSVWAGTRNVTRSFVANAGGTQLQGVVSGLPLGDTVITVLAGMYKEQLTLTNYPVTGPMFAGPK